MRWLDPAHGSPRFDIVSHGGVGHEKEGRSTVHEQADTSSRPSRARTDGMRRVVKLLACLLVLWVVPAWATNFAVCPSATGSGNGSDWNNCAAWSSLSPARGSGNTYYLADGSYGSKTLSTAQSGSTVITLKKAIEADHGPSIGWVSTLGDGTASMGVLTINSGYWTIDGQGGAGFSTLPADRTPSNYGIQWLNITQPIVLADSANSPNVTLRHLYLLGPAGSVTNKWAIKIGANFSAVAQNLTVEYCLMDRWNNALNVAGTGANTGLLWQYNVMLNAFSNAADHGEWINS